MLKNSERGQGATLNVQAQQTATSLADPVTQQPGQRPPGQTLLIDADDTLWENNIYFEEAIARFTTFLDHQTHTPDEVRAHLDRIERETTHANGYGLKSFRASLTRCLEELAGAAAVEAQHKRIAEFAAYIGDHAIELLDGVADTLGVLARRHRLILVTKGNREEQMGKLAVSGLRHLFSEAEVLAEKNERSYRELIDRYGLAPAHTWMIGNSPKSDINPALAAGLNAVLIPHPHTWRLEHEELARAPAGQVLLRLGNFAALQRHF